jgi:GcrA cell cycle regulator
MTDDQIPEWMANGRLQKARRLWDEGLSCRDIAAAIGHGCTADAIIGKARRQHWPPHPKPPNGVAERAAALKAGVRYGRTAEYQRKRRKTADPWGAKPLRVPCEPEKLAAPTLAFSVCQWPQGERGDWRWCDAPAIAGKPYCAQHQARAHERTPHRGDVMWGVSL